MGGNAGIRGYVIQTIICLLDALELDNEWKTVTLEPVDESEKVDIRWRYSEGKEKLTQVKSSQNLIRYSKAKKWSDDLETHSPNANEYELVLIGNTDEKLSKTRVIGNVAIGDFRPLNTGFLIDQASTKIDAYFEAKGKNKISVKVRELIINALSSSFSNSSIIGEEITRQSFDNRLLEWISAIEKQIELNPFASLAPPSENKKRPINHRIVKKILELIGWRKFNENVEVKIFNDKTNLEEKHSVNFYGEFESKLKSKSADSILTTSIHSLTYPNSSKSQITNFLYSNEVVFCDLKRKNKIPIKKFDNTDYYGLLFWLSTNNNQIFEDFIFNAKINFKQNLLNEEITYFLIDNRKAIFLVNAIITAKNYREDVPVKFFYPITEANQSYSKIGSRGFKLPVQFINSSIIPIIKENKSKISFLLFCSDKFNPTTLKKLIWLTIKLTSGLGNEYLLYFPDYDESKDKNTASEVIRSFNEELLDEKIHILKYSNIGVEALDSLPESIILNQDDEIYDEISKKPINNHLNEAFTDILPYGDILKPFLKTEAITANDLKYFLAKKGIFTKKADKTKLIELTSSLLFSPKEIEDFKTYITIKEKKVHTHNTIFNLENNESIEGVLQKVKISFDNLDEGLDAKIINIEDVKFEAIPDSKDEYRICLITERKDPTSSLIVNTKPGKAEIIIKKENNKLIVLTTNTVSKQDKYIANRLLKNIEKEFKRIKFIKDDKIKILFSHFLTNTQRVNFLLSFSNIESSNMLKEADIQSIKFKFDEATEIPELYKDKADKDLIINFEGKGLDTLKELSELNAKESIFLEEMKVLYKFNYLNVKNGFYKVTFNFSNALKNKPEFDGDFKSSPFLIKNYQIKSLSNIEKLEKELSKEIERLKIEKYKEFNIVE